MATKKKLDAYLAEIFKQFIAIKDDDLKRAQEVFKNVFEEVKKNMGKQDNYFKKYCRQDMYAGSVYDGIKVSQMNEFDMDIVIRLPIHVAEGDDGISLEPDQPGFVRMRIVKAFDNLDKQPEWEKCHKVTREWRDSEKYFLQNKFRQWMHGIVQKALNEMNGQVTVNGVAYQLKYKESGPAFTLNISNMPGDEEFLLDVDLVPVIRFMHPRWPKGYRSVEGTQVKEWLVVPKPNKAVQKEALKNRCWRLSFQEFEREMMKDCQQLKTTIRLIKKLRDALEMKAIASYYIKTLFLWKIENNDKKFWQNKLSFTFRVMVEELLNAIAKKNIPYFWHQSNNLIEGLKPTIQKIYVDKLTEVVKAIDSNDVDKIVASLLTTTEMAEFKRSEFYQKQAAKDVKDSVNVSKPTTVSNSPANMSRQTSSASNSSSNQSSQEFCNGGNITDSLLKQLISKIDKLTHKVGSLEERMSRLEKATDAGGNSVLDEKVFELMADTRALRLDDYEKIIKNDNGVTQSTDVVDSSASDVHTLIDLN